MGLKFYNFYRNSLLLYRLIMEEYNSKYKNIKKRFVHIFI